MDNKAIATLEEALSATVQEQLIHLIPKEEWSKLVRHEINKFEEHAAVITREAIKKSFEELLKKSIDEILNSSEWNATLATNKNKLISDIIKDNAPAILASMIEDYGIRLIQTFRSQLSY